MIRRFDAKKECVLVEASLSILSLVAMVNALSIILPAVIREIIGFYAVYSKKVTTQCPTSV
jgi:hypothetical protein